MQSSANFPNPESQKEIQAVLEGFKKSKYSSRIVKCYADLGVDINEFVTCFCNDQKPNYANILELNASDIDQLKENFSTAVKQCLGNEYRKEFELDGFQDWLMTNSCLVVFKNVKDINDIQPYMPRYAQDVLIAFDTAYANIQDITFPGYPSVKIQPNSANIARFANAPFSLWGKKVIEKTITDGLKNTLDTINHHDLLDIALKNEEIALHVVTDPYLSLRLRNALPKVESGKPDSTKLIRYVDGQYDPAKCLNKTGTYPSVANPIEELKKKHPKVADILNQTLNQSRQLPRL